VVSNTTTTVNMARTPEPVDETGMTSPWNAHDGSGV